VRRHYWCWLWLTGPPRCAVVVWNLLARALFTARPEFFWLCEESAMTSWAGGRAVIGTRVLIVA
jgi:hypothetical protein